MCLWYTALRGGKSIGRPYFSFSLQVTIKAGTANAQHLGRSHPIARAQVEHPINMLFANIVQGKRTPRFVGSIDAERLLESFGQIVHVDKVV